MAHRNICKTNTSANKRKDSPSLTESKVKNVGPSQDLDPEAVAYFRAKCARLEGPTFFTLLSVNEGESLRLFAEVLVLQMLR